MGGDDLMYSAEWLRVCFDCCLIFINENTEHTRHISKLPCETRPSTTVVIVRPFFEILVVLVRSAERERLVRVLDGDADRCDERDDGRGNEFRPSFILNFTLNIFHF